jgi:DNA-binding NarL/FixJ family response regulator
MIPPALIAEDCCVKLMLVDDHALLREGLAAVISQLDEISEVIQQGNGNDAINYVLNNDDLDIVLLDYDLGDLDGLTVLDEIKSQQAEIPVVMLSAHQESDLIHRALSHHASGFITKSSTTEVMLSAIKLVLAGGIYIPTEILNALSATQPSVKPSPHVHLASAPIEREYQLTERQLDVIRELAKGLSNKEIARVLSMSPSTVKVHIAAILKEFDVKNRTQAASLAKQSGLLIE